MTGFEFDKAPSPGTNRHGAAVGCPTCDDHKLIPVVGEGLEEVYTRCPDCNPAPTTERAPVQDARWKTYDR